MKALKFAIVGCVVAAFVLSVQGKARTIVGVVAAVDADSLRAATKTESTESVRLSSTTNYMKWITRRPWGQDTRADRRLLETGRCVAIEVLDGEPSVARLIRISDEKAGTIWYPCHP